MKQPCAQPAHVDTFLSRWSLFRQPHYQPQAFPTLDFLFNLFFALSCVAVATVFSVIQWRSRPLTLHTISISNHSLLSSLPSDYVCDCSLPAYLQGVQSVQNLDTSPFRRCYRKDVLQTVTIVQFSNNTVPHLPDIVLRLSNISQPNFTRFQNGYTVTQSPLELILWKGDPKNILNSRIVTSPLLEGNGVLNLPLDELVKSLYFDFPRGYMRIAFQYWCTNCTYCGLDKLLHLPGFHGIDVKTWASCAGFGSHGNNCLSDDPSGGYEGRCYIYPTYDVPMAARLKQFFTTFTTMPYIDFISSTFNFHATGLIDLQLYLLYVNVSHFTENVPMTYGFLEVDKLSSAWLTLLEQFPGMANSCRENATIEICNGTSFCNAFKTSADLGSSSISLSCTDFRDNYNVCIQLADSSGNGYWNETLCPQHFTCRNVPQQSVVYNLEGENFDNRLMAGRMKQRFNDTYAWGVCSNTYENVVRHGDELWATECTDTGLCHLTGKYHSPHDPSWEEPKSSPDLLPYATPLYICYAARKQKLLSWGINTAGVMFGWLSSLLVGVRCIYYFVEFVAQRFTKRRKASSEGDDTSLKGESHNNHVELAPYTQALEEQPLFPASRRRQFKATTSLPVRIVLP